MYLYLYLSVSLYFSYLSLSQSFIPQFFSFQGFKNHYDCILSCHLSFFSPAFNESISVRSFLLLSMLLTLGLINSVSICSIFASLSVSVPYLFRFSSLWPCLFLCLISVSSPHSDYVSICVLFVSFSLLDAVNL